MSIYDCPHCGEKTFNPLTKALAGAINSRGRACKKCGRKCVNGQTAAIVRLVLSLVMGALVLLIYLGVESVSTGLLLGACVIFTCLLLNGLFNAFFLPLIKAIRTDA